VSNTPYTSLNLGLSTRDPNENVQVNRCRLFAAAGFSTGQLVIAGQVHGSKIKVATEAGLYPGYDGLVTRVPGLLLCISAADCAAVLLTDAEARVIGACHSGWRGTVANISGKTVVAMAEMGSEPSRLKAYISPCISMANFEVGPEVAAQFDETFVHHLPDEPKPRVDLKAVIASQLEEAGVVPQNIEISPHCTMGETDTFFSYRAENGLTGRMMGFIGMKVDD
jgi:YfiH family protein